MYQELFEALAVVYESAAQLKAEWLRQWDERVRDDLPPKYQIDDPIAPFAARDMRYGAALLQRNRWRSVVSPLFAEIEPQRWTRFVNRVAPTAATLLHIRDIHTELLLSDELDWIDDAIERFDDVARRVRHASQDGVPLERQVAEGAYQYVLQAIRLSDRLIERLRFEAAQKK